MSARVFVDTNILVYAHDRDAGRKRQIARDILGRLAVERSGVLSLQVLQEFYTTVTRKLPARLPRDEARAVVADFFHWSVATTPAEILHAFRIEDEAHIGFWDALVVAVALKSGATRLLTEDLNAGQRIAGLVIENPFAAPALGEAPEPPSRPE